ncbi:hypothetical protein AXK60_24595 [Tsukamurella pseudospumae]|uniref:Uncharacterized protein n=2 Tax=Tsukamurella pseudospumae TaxID=239498 RepID=A0A138AMJ6_9ACTN|nr:hypothetical protein AXK60_24595 [Tsukamurella pseudospumae]
MPHAGGRRQFKRTSEEMFLESFGSIQNQIDIMRSGLIDLDNLYLDNPRATACDLYAASNYLRKLAHRIEGT